jgi:diacylglycerol kinase (ATP)
MPRRKALVIFNPAAGRRRRPKLEEALRALAREGVSAVVRETTAPGDAEIFARDADRESFDVIIAAGGDGTINEVINGLREDSPPLGLLPLGTANVLAAEIALPRRTDVLAALLSTGPVRDLWPGEVNGRRFAMMAGIGFDAAVVDRVDIALKRRMGKGAYVLEAAEQLFRLAPTRYELTIDGTPMAAAAAIICRGRRYGGRYVIAPDASIFERRFELCLFTNARRRHVLRAALNLGLGRLHADPNVRLVKATRISAAGQGGEPVQCDGNIICRLPARFRISATPVRLITPG